MSANDTKLIEAIVKYLNTNPTFESQKEIPPDEGVLLTLRKKVQTKSSICLTVGKEEYTLYRLIKAKEQICSDTQN